MTFVIKWIELLLSKSFRTLGRNAVAWGLAAFRLVPSQRVIRERERQIERMQFETNVNSQTREKAPGFEKNCSNMPDYVWTNETLRSFLSFAAQQVGVRQADVWRCDIDHYGRTADWFISAMAAFLATP